MARELFERRREYTKDRVEEFRTSFLNSLGSDVARVLADHTCVYATGSGGRGELSQHSDLDLFTVRQGEPSNLDAILIRAALVRATRDVGFPEPSNDGQFLATHSADRLIDMMGTPEDDTENTFTARMLMLLESTPVAGAEVYDSIIRRVVDRYWGNTDEHPRDYLPIILLNDIVRYWRILLLNYEAKKSKTFPEQKLRSYKLRFARCMTCYSAIAYLLAAERRGNGHVESQVAVDMVKLPPLKRLEWVQSEVVVPAVTEAAERIFDLYEGFLRTTDAPKPELLAAFGDRDTSKKLSAEATAFGDAMAKLMVALGEGGRLIRYLIV